MEVLVFEGQGAQEVDGVDLAALTPADAQTAIVRHQLARARSRPEAPVACLGQSLGELSALVIAGALDEGDALELVRLRAELPAKLLGDRAFSMGSFTRARIDVIEELVADHEVWIAGRNSPADCIVVGEAGAFAAFLERLGAAPNTYRMIPVQSPYHTPAMAPVAEEIAAAVARLDVRDPVVPVVTPTGARVLTTAAEAGVVVVEALTTPVAWPEALGLAVATFGPAAFRDCGPTHSLSRFTWKNGHDDLDWAEA